MWHEARKQEKKLRGMIVDYRKRAERRREFYEKFKADPTQFMQVHGRPCKIYMDPTITTAADNSLMPWQGNKETIIDRFDVRAHLEYIPEPCRPSASSEPVSLDGDAENSGELNYERYRILIQNEFTNVSEDKFLHQIHIEEQYGTSSTKEMKSSKALLQPKAAIAYNYEDSTPIPTPAFISHSKSDAAGNEDESDDDLDFDLLVNVNDLNTLQKVELNTSGTKYGMKNTEFMTYLTNDVKERENLKLMKLQEEEKQHLSGRKARRERRAYKDRHRLRRENYSPPSYAASPLEPLAERAKRSSSESDSSTSPERVTYITSFGPKSNDVNSIFGPNLPKTYKKKRPELVKRRRRTTNSSSSDDRRGRSKKHARHRGRRRSSSSSSSISSSSSDSSYRRRQRKKSPSPKPTERRYYNRHKSPKSGSDSKSDSDSSDEYERNHPQRSTSTKESVGSGGGSEKGTNNTASKDSTSGTGVSTVKLTPQERLKRKMQMALNKQLKADKDAEKLRNERLEQERIDREESLREISLKYRRKERERRHVEKSGSGSSSGSDRRSKSRSLSRDSS